MALQTSRRAPYRRLPARSLRRRLFLELLEQRLAPAVGDAIADAFHLSFTNISATQETAHVREYLAESVFLGKFELTSGQVVTAAVNTAPHGGGLNSFLRLFLDNGDGTVRQIASNDNFRGLDPSLTYQATVAGTYYVGVSSFHNSDYDPLFASSASGSSRGLFDLNLSKSTSLSAPGLVAASFELSQTTGVLGDNLVVSYTIENRGGA